MNTIKHFLLIVCLSTGIPLLAAEPAPAAPTNASVSSIQVIPLKYADAKHTATLISSLFTSPGGGSAATARVVAVGDDRTHALVVSAPADLMATIENTVKDIDIIKKLMQKREKE
jgi:hypothetical protein